MATGNAFVRVLEEDPELAAGLDPTSVHRATRHAIAAVERIAMAIEDHSYSRGAIPRSELGRAVQDALAKLNVGLGRKTGP